MPVQASHVSSLYESRRFRLVGIELFRFVCPLCKVSGDTMICPICYASADLCG